MSEIIFVRLSERGDYLTVDPRDLAEVDLVRAAEDQLISDDTVAARIAFRGTHDGEFQGLPPTNREVAFTSVEINRMVDGKVAEHWFEFDQGKLFEQLGLTVISGPRLLPRILGHQVKKLLPGSARTTRRHGLDKEPPWDAAPDKKAAAPTVPKLLPRSPAARSRFAVYPSDGESRGTLAALPLRAKTESAAAGPERSIAGPQRGSNPY
jgi:SnoaL-like polyketide cyclase